MVDSAHSPVASMRLLLLLLALAAPPALALDDNATPQFVTYFSVAKLQHVASHVRLHSSTMTYGTGSGQQAVTGFPRGGDPDSFWLIKGPHAQPIPHQGAPIKCGATVRFQHVSTGANLHAHNHRSPLTKNIEVSAYGSAEQVGDESDNFVVECADVFWTRGNEVTFKHINMGGYLTTNAQVRFPNTIREHQEVCLMKAKNVNARWRTHEGVYFLNVAS